MNIKGSSLSTAQKVQDKNMIGLSNMLHRIFNQIKVINTN